MTGGTSLPGESGGARLFEKAFEIHFSSSKKLRFSMTKQRGQQHIHVPFHLIATKNAFSHRIRGIKVGVNGFFSIRISQQQFNCLGSAIEPSRWNRKTLRQSLNHGYLWIKLTSFNGFNRG